MAVVVARADNGLTDTAVTEFCKARLASYKKPAAVVFVEQLPRNASDKVRPRGPPTLRPGDIRAHADVQ